jgi:hypothetical protein
VYGTGVSYLKQTVPDGNGFTPNNAFITSFSVTKMQSVGGIGSFSSISWSTFDQVNVRPSTYTKSYTLGFVGSSTLTFNAPVGYALSGLHWVYGRTGGMKNLQIRVSYIHEDGVNVRKPDKIISLWSTPSTSGFQQSSEYRAKTANMTDIDTYFADYTDLPGSFTSTFIGEMEIYYNRPSVPTTDEGFMQINWIRYLNISEYYRARFPVTQTDAEICCLQTPDRSTYYLHSYACERANLAPVSDRCEITFRNYCEQNMNTEFCQQSMLKDMSTGRWDSSVDNVCSVSSFRNRPENSDFCSCYFPLTFDSTINEATKNKVNGKPKCASSRCKNKGYQNLVQRGSVCPVPDLIPCLKQTTTTVNGLVVPDPITAVESDSCKLLLNPSITPVIPPSTNPINTYPEEDIFDQSLYEQFKELETWKQVLIVIGSVFGIILVILGFYFGTMKLIGGKSKFD